MSECDSDGELMHCGSPEADLGPPGVSCCRRLVKHETQLRTSLENGLRNRAVLHFVIFTAQFYYQLLLSALRVHINGLASPLKLAD